MSKRMLLLLFVISGCLQLRANVDKQLWIGYIHQGRISNKWGYWLDVHHRTKNNFLQNLHTDIVRVGGTYFINDHLRVTLGYAFIIQFPSLTNQGFVRPEHRPWQQIFYTINHKRIRFIQYVRSEQRFINKTEGETLVDGFHFRQRFRYNAMLITVLTKNGFKQGAVGLVLNDEVMVNAYSTDKVKAYDQNRAFAGLSFNITDALQLHAGYMNIYAFTPKGPEIVHAIRLFLMHSHDFRKKKG
jgi:hypothetical protein